MNDPWVVIVIAGIMCIIASWMIKEPKPTFTMTQEMEEALDLVAANLDEENRELMRTISQLKNDYDRKSEAWENKIAILERRIEELSSEQRNLLLMKLYQEQQPEKHTVTSPQSPASSSSSSITASVPDTAEAEVDAESTQQDLGGLKLRYPELFRMYKQGKSIEQIAKKLGINKGETTLIIQLAKQEEAGRV